MTKFLLNSFLILVFLIMTCLKLWFYNVFSLDVACLYLRTSYVILPVLSRNTHPQVCWNLCHYVVSACCCWSLSRLKTGSMNFVRNWASVSSLTWIRTKESRTHSLFMLERTRWLLFHILWLTFLTGCKNLEHYS